MTSEKQDIYLRSHTVVIDKPKETRKGSHRPRATKEHPRWAKWAVVLDCETRTDVRQELTFGFYRVLQLVGDDGDDGCTYELVEEGASSIHRKYIVARHACLKCLPLADVSIFNRLRPTVIATWC